MIALTLAACQSELPEPIDPAATYATYGEALTPDGAVPVQAVVAERAQFVDRSVKIEGVVSEVCQAKGCWLTLQAEGDNIRINVPRDEENAYVFTVPKDISGRRVVVEGMLTEATLSAETQHHYDEDTGHTHEGAEYHPRTELQMTASGVLVEKRKT